MLLAILNGALVLALIIGVGKAGSSIARGMFR